MTDITNLTWNGNTAYNVGIYYSLTEFTNKLTNLISYKLTYTFLNPTETNRLFDESFTSKQDALDKANTINKNEIIKNLA